jgi:hypothetical protein
MYYYIHNENSVTSRLVLSNKLVDQKAYKALMVVSDLLNEKFLPDDCECFLRSRIFELSLNSLWNVRMHLCDNDSKLIRETFKKMRNSYKFYRCYSEDAVSIKIKTAIKKILLNIDILLCKKNTDHE